MDQLLAAVFADPKAWVAAIILLVGTPAGWLWRLHVGLRTRVETCERERAVLDERLRATSELLAVERGRVDALTDLFKKEAHVG